MPTKAQVFENFLSENPSKLGEFIAIIQEFLTSINDSPETDGPSKSQPRKWKIGEEHEMSLEGISDDELDELLEGAAEGDVLERALAFASGFISGVLF